MDPLTDYELSQLDYPEIPIRLSQRQSNSRTKAVARRTFSGLLPWENFLQNAADLARTLDNQIKRNVDPMFMFRNLATAADEIGVRVPVEGYVFPVVNRLAATLNLRMEYWQCGSGRAASRTDLLIVDSSQQQDLNNISARVYGDGEAKGSWQWDLDDDQTMESTMNDPKRQPATIEVLQQLFGDMILDEARYGFLTNYNKTVFFRRKSGRDKSLEYSPVISASSAPLEKFLYVLHCAEQDKALKPTFSRLLVKETPPGGYKVTLPVSTRLSKSGRVIKRPRSTISVNANSKTRKTRQATDSDENCSTVFFEDQFSAIPAYDMEELSISGKVIGLAKFGNVLDACIGNQGAALKCFDLRDEKAGSAFIQEQIAYEKLKPIQGRTVPSLLLVGRIPHTNILYLALTNEGKVLKKVKPALYKPILKALDEIHTHGVLHGDIKLSHVLWKQQGRSKPKLIDFDASRTNVSEADLREETECMEDLLFSHETDEFEQIQSSL